MYPFHGTRPCDGRDSAMLLERYVFPSFTNFLHDGLRFIPSHKITQRKNSQLLYIYTKKLETKKENYPMKFRGFSWN